MRLVLFVILFVPTLVFAHPSGFIHPFNFDDSEEQKKQIFAYIQNAILHNYCGSQSESCHSSIIIIEREENLKAFYELTLITNKEYLNKIIDEYCNSEFFRCTYANLLSAYKESRWLDEDLVSMQKSNDYSRYQAQFLSDHGPLTAGLIVFGAAFITLYVQREAIRSQTNAQASIENNRIFLSKVEDLYNIIERIRLKAVLIRTDKINRVAQEINSLYLDLGEASMICRAHRVINRHLFEEYRKNTENFIVSWSSYAAKLISGDDAFHEGKDFNMKFKLFKDSTDGILKKLIEHLKYYPAP